MTRRVVTHRKFGGKEFKLRIGATTKREAQVLASDIRKTGYNVRVTRVGDYDYTLDYAIGSKREYGYFSRRPKTLHGRPVMVKYVYAVWARKG